VLDHLDHAADEFTQLGGMSLRVTAAGEVEQLLGDLLAAEGFALNHLQVVAGDLHFFDTIGAGAFEQVLQAAFERLAAEGDRRERIVDFVRHAGGEESDAGELLAADDLVRPLLHLAIEVVANFAEALRHRVHRFGEFADLVAGADLDTVVEVTRGDQTRAVDQDLQRIGEPLIEEAA
jgi:hypothetical protein